MVKKMIFGEVSEEYILLAEEKLKVKFPQIYRDFIKKYYEFDMNLHKTVVEYFNSYLFADLDGFYQEHYITLEPIHYWKIRGGEALGGK